MRQKLSVAMITRNSESTLRLSLESVFQFADEIVIVDDFSSDETVEIATEFSAKIYFNHEQDLGKQKQLALRKTKYPWVLLIDSDEIVSTELKKEIIQILEHPNDSVTGYYVPYQNFLFNKPLSYGGENYKMLRFFKKTAVQISPNMIHEHVTTTSGKTAQLKNKLYHYSYRSAGQLLAKFSGYAVREAKRKYMQGEQVTLKKLTMYPVHMVWARFIKDKGYKDGPLRIILDLSFGYMELLTYLILLLYNIGFLHREKRELIL